jgi:hypothetical protein
VTWRGGGGGAAGAAPGVALNHIAPERVVTVSERRLLQFLAVGSGGTRRQKLRHATHKASNGVICHNFALVHEHSHGNDYLGPSEGIG